MRSSEIWTETRVREGISLERDSSIEKTHILAIIIRATREGLPRDLSLKEIRIFH
jgi:hypothetical protein